MFCQQKKHIGECPIFPPLDCFCGENFQVLSCNYAQEVYMVLFLMFGRFTGNLYESFLCVRNLHRQLI